MASGLSSNWKSLAKTLGKKPAKSSSSRQRPSAPAPGEAPADDGSAAQAKRHRTEDTQDSSTAAPAGSGQPSAASPAHDSLASDTPAAIVSTVKRDLGILESLLTAKSSFLSPPSDDEDTDNVASSGAGVANPARKRKRATESAAAIPPLQSETKIGKYVAMDCEMVGVGAEGTQSALARVSIVNFHGHLILDAYVTVDEPITDFRTHVSGIRAETLRRLGRPFKDVQKEVADIIKDRILVGHALKNDLGALLLSHPLRLLRDTSSFKPLRHPKTGKAQALRKLAQEHLGLEIQTGEHSPVEDARAAMRLYQKFRKDWESTVQRRERRNAEERLIKAT